MNEFDTYQDLLPQGGIPVAGIKALIYLNAQGETCYQFSQSGEVPISTVLGTIEMIKGDIHDAITEANRRGK